MGVYVTTGFPDLERRSMSAEAIDNQRRRSQTAATADSYHTHSMGVRNAFNIQLEIDGAHDSVANIS